GAVGPHRERRLRAVLLAAGGGRPFADSPAREAEVRLLDRALLARLPAPRLRPRPPREGRAVPPARSRPQPRTPGRLPPGVATPLRPPAPRDRAPTRRGRAARPRRALGFEPHPRGGRVRRPDLPQRPPDRDPRAPPPRPHPRRGRADCVRAP